MCTGRARRVLISMLMFGLALVPRVGRADAASNIRLSVWAQPELGCSDAQHLRALVESRIGSPMLSEAGTAQRFVDIQVQPAAHGSGFVATLVLRDADGRVLGDRELSTQAASCDSLDPMLVLVLSTLIGPSAMPPLAADENTSEAQEQTSSSHRRQANRVPTPNRDAEAEALSASTLDAPLEFSLGLGAQVITGLLPGIAPAALVALLVRYQRLELRTKLGATAPVQSDLGGGARAEWFSILGEAQACGVATQTTAVGLSFCAGVGGGGLSAQTHGLFQNVRSVQSVFLLVLNSTLQLRVLPRQVLLLSGGVNLPLRAPRYYFWEQANERRDFHAVELGAFAEIGWLWRFSS